MGNYALLGLTVISVCIVYLMWLTAITCEYVALDRLDLSAPEDKFAFCVMPTLVLLDLWFLIQEVKATMLVILN